MTISRQDVARKFGVSRISGPRYHDFGSITNLDLRRDSLAGDRNFCSSFSERNNREKIIETSHFMKQITIL